MAYDSTSSIPLEKVRIQDEFWSDYIRLVRDVVVPYQWEALNDRVPEAEPSHAIRNFKIAAGEEQGSFYGMVFQDSDVSKWLEATAYLLETAPDPELERIADGVIELIGKAQQPDGYLNTYFTLEEPGNRWTNLAECHELYCAGHLIEAAVAYFKATGKRRLLDIACKLADHIDSVFGSEPGKLRGYDGHQEIELALMKLYHATGRDAYLQLCRFFVEQRGMLPHFYEEEWEKRGGTVHFKDLAMSHDLTYSQAHLPVRKQDAAVGHAVRMVYMCTGMADLAKETGDAGLLEACRRLWTNMTKKRMYITGGIGSMAHGESFTLDYDLPNDTVYAETCASIGLIFFARRMQEIDPRGEYADVMERALYNTVVSGMSRDGKRFFYVNPLEAQPEVCEINPAYAHVKLQRQGWFGCACCPPNIARLLASLGQYIYTLRNDALYVHLYIGGRIDWEADGQAIALEQISDYAWNGKSRFRVHANRAVNLTLALRIPGWSNGEAVVHIEGRPYVYSREQLVNGYLYVTRSWKDGETLSIAFPMRVQRMKGHPSIRHTIGKAAIQRGPFVYCIEEADNGPELHAIQLSDADAYTTYYDSGLLGGLQVIEAEARRISPEGWGDKLYRSGSESLAQAAKLRLIPYFAWANRGVGEMAVWIRDSQ
ncbi:beta-L-arabinofuranosidase domain-containing protein [Paenibacillus sp. HB172176]|uniref:glycoside hydrolase family 127 protein n=1 Tax=Paenibacillus sp. HB172176 TaxID=2493690 RepID=UPI00197E7C11|nr:beta-L-arabinofuranosidase domain-containing protein [Paenibacillus sp. HB172176]